MLNGSDPDQDWRFVGPDLGPNHLERFFTRWQESPLATKELTDWEDVDWKTIVDWITKAN